jgi:hypothetical protein
MSAAECFVAQMRICVECRKVIGIHAAYAAPKADMEHITFVSVL